MRIPWRVARANTTLLLAGVGCVLVVVTGAGLSVGGVSAKGLTSLWAQVAVGVAGAVLVAASFVVGVEPPESSVDGRSRRRPVGGFLGEPPRRTSWFVARRELERLVEALVRADGRAVALVGMGGAGKTVLAAEAVQDRALRRRFRDGVAWLAVAPRADVLALQSDLARRLGGGEAVFRDASEGRGVLAELLGGRRALVVLDNVWERAVLDAVPPDCQLLFTSRSVGLAHDVNATPVEVAELELEQAFALLGKWTGRERGELDRLPAAEICRGLDRLALGVAMAGAMIGRGDEKRWGDVLARLETADLGRIRADFGDEYPHPTLLAAIELGIDELPDEPTRQRYRELAVFNGRSPFPRSAVEALWAPAGLSGPDAGDLLALLEGRSLVHPEGQDRYTLHDLQADVVAHQLGPHGLTEAHAQLLAGYLPPEPVDWPSVSDDGYLFDNLAYHLARAGRSDELRDLLTDFSWLHTKLQSVGLVSVLVDYTQLPDDPAAQTLRAALRLSAPTLIEDPAQLPGQLIGRLRDGPDPAIARLLDRATNWSQSPWLCPLTGALESPHGPLRLTLRHTGWVGAVAVSADARQIVSAGADGTVRVWELDSGRELRRLEGHSGAVGAVAVSADARHIVSAGNDGTVRVWELDSGRELRRLEGHTGWVGAVAVSADARHIVSADADGTVRVWELDSGRELRRLEGHTGWVGAVAVSADARHIVSAGNDGTVRVWELDSGRELRRLEGHSGAVGAVAVSADARHIVSAGADHTVRVWELDSGRELRRLEGHSGAVWAVGVSADGRHIVSAGADGTVRVWELDSGRETVRWTGDSEITACTTSLGAPLTLAVGEARGATYALRLQGAIRA